ncbi:MAG: tRNA (adenosine(37)-N6)-threonylcarbamoyltransferase complex dimerization subunit type 1 TsaB [Candidatus Latescibacteria bacterium]|nr:tRNA (adenosine(37)-N6)-threonylcarbamoyltransferase complex dimerization subunit type 1 TsaB [Candidatus Latescibacterota bacterium]
MILALETATPAASIALVDKEKTIASRYFDIGLQHSRLLYPEIQAIFNVADCRPAELEAVAVSIGPGSFTGLRIGLSTAKGLCLAREIDLVAVPTLESLAAQLPFAAHPVCPVLDARQREVYAALYDTSSGWPSPLAEARALEPEQLLEERRDQRTIFVGDGIWQHRQLLADFPQALVPPRTYRQPEASTVGQLAYVRLNNGQTANLAMVEPNYIRAPAVRAAASGG